MPAQEFRDGCAARNIKVGRNFPPYQDAWARISISTMEDMQFKKMLVLRSGEL